MVIMSYCIYLSGTLEMSLKIGGTVGKFEKRSSLEFLGLCIGGYQVYGHLQTL